jgi:hypothetical protein
MSHAGTSSSDAEEIQRQMREVRVELRDEVQELVGNARELTDWPAYVRAYPWVCVGAAFAVGFLIVPSRPTVIRPDAEGLMELARRNKLIVKMDTTPAQKRGGLVADLVGMATGALLQRGIGIATAQVTHAMEAAAKTRSNGHLGATP